MYVKKNSLKVIKQTCFLHKFSLMFLFLIAEDSTKLSKLSKEKIDLVKKKLKSD